MAIALRDWLPRVLPGVSPWMSTEIPKGERWAESIGRRLATHHIGLICVTPENMSAAWLTYEAGALSKSLDSAQVCPVLLGLAPTDVEGPLDQFQPTVFEHLDMLSLIRTLNQQLGDMAMAPGSLEEAFERNWPELCETVAAAARIEIGQDHAPQVIRTFARYGLPEPRMGSTAFFAEGFESHGLYSTACSVAQKRLLVFGRKNRKMFDKEHASFFVDLLRRCQNGFEFRCLFLDPEAPEYLVRGAHNDSGFREDLCRCIETACQVLEANQINPDDHLRLYRMPRVFASVLVDDAIAYTPIRYAQDGRVAPLTKTGFAVINASSFMGQALENQFLDTWASARPVRGATPSSPLQAP